VLESGLTTFLVSSFEHQVSSQHYACIPANEARRTVVDSGIVPNVVPPASRPFKLFAQEPDSVGRSGDRFRSAETESIISLYGNEIAVQGASIGSAMPTAQTVARRMWTAQVFPNRTRRRYRFATNATAPSPEASKPQIRAGIDKGVGGVACGSLAKGLRDCVATTASTATSRRCPHQQVPANLERRETASGVMQWTANVFARIPRDMGIDRTTRSRTMESGAPRPDRLQR